MSQREKNRQYRYMRHYIDKHLGGWRVGDYVESRDPRLGPGIYRILGFVVDERGDWRTAVFVPNAKDEILLTHFSYLHFHRGGSR